MSSSTSRTVSFGKAINEGLKDSLREDKKVICFGLGVDDPKGVFGTTIGLKEEFGAKRVFDMPNSENAMTGVALGASLNGIRPVMTHQRLDFFLLAMDQLVNNAAKWFYMFGGACSVPITIRLIIGRGWGQGPTHSQSLQAWFAHIPGLKVVMPTFPDDAKGLLISSIFDENPVVFIEHRWLHNLEGPVPEGVCRVPIGKARQVCEGNNLTIVSMSYMTIEALHAIEYLKPQGISIDLIDLRTIQPMDWDSILHSVEKTGRLLVLDTATGLGSIASEIVAKVCMEKFSCLQQSPFRIALPDVPTPTSPSLSEGFYPRAEDIVSVIGKMLKKDLRPDLLREQRTTPHDVPGEWFRGPF